jgi:hypothetical protein
MMIVLLDGCQSDQSGFGGGVKCWQVLMLGFKLEVCGLGQQILSGDGEK